MRRLIKNRLPFWLVFLSLPCFAHPKTDTVILGNGNSLTCEIRQLSRGVLNAKTDALSSVSIRWADVARVQSEYTFEITVKDGTTYFAVLNTDSNGKLLLADGATIPLSTVVGLTELGSRFANRFNGSTDAGYSYMRSNKTTQLNFDGDLAYTTRRRSIDLQVSNTLVVRENTASTRRTQAGLTLNETLPRRNFALVIGQFSTNDELNLLQRYLAGAAFGHYLIHTNHSMFSAYAGGADSLERYSGSERRNNSEALLGFHPQFFRLISPKVDISADFRLWPNLTTAGRYRIDSNANVKVEVYKNLFLSVSFFDNYDRKNPTTSTPLNDYGFVTSVGYSFNR